MNLTKETPLFINKISDTLYSGFWARLGALMLDSIFLIPFILLVQYINGFGKYIYFITLVPYLLIVFGYQIYLPKKYGGTPGKLIVGNTIICINGQPITWKEAILRHCVTLILTIVSVVFYSICISQADDETFKSLSWIKRSRYLMSFSPSFFQVYNIINIVWVFSEFVVLLTNKRKRALHDFLAGTVIVKTKYLEEIRASMYFNEV